MISLVATIGCAKEEAQRPRVKISVSSVSPLYKGAFPMPCLTSEVNSDSVGLVRAAQTSFSRSLQEDLVGEICQNTPMSI